MGLRYLILGAGKQGTAAGYDLARWSEAERVTFADLDLARANAAAERVNRLVGREAAVGVAGDLNPANPGAGEQIVALMREHHGTLNAANYNFNPALTALAIEAGRHFADLGGSTEITLEQRKQDAPAREKGVYIVPDCGLAPGAVNQIAAYLLERYPTLTSIQLHCGGLPVAPKPPLGYQLVFNIQGLTVEYRGLANYLRGGEIVKVPTLTELAPVSVPGVGDLEAAVTSGGTSLAPWSFQGKLQEYTYKTLRWPGHWAVMSAFKELGFLDDEPVTVNGRQVSPLELFHVLVPRALGEPTDPTFVVVYVRAEGPGLDARLTLKVDDDTETGLRSMERATGFPAAITLAAVAEGRSPVEPGVVPPELAVAGGVFHDALVTRGLVPQIQG